MQRWAMLLSSLLVTFMCWGALAETGKGPHDVVEDAKAVDAHSPDASGRDPGAAGLNRVEQVTQQRKEAAKSTVEGGDDSSALPMIVAIVAGVLVLLVIGLFYRNSRRVRVQPGGKASSTAWARTDDRSSPVARGLQSEEHNGVARQLADVRNSLQQQWSTLQGLQQDLDAVREANASMNRRVAQQQAEMEDRLARTDMELRHSQEERQQRLCKDILARAQSTVCEAQAEHERLWNEALLCADSGAASVYVMLQELVRQNVLDSQSVQTWMPQFLGRSAIQLMNVSQLNAPSLDQSVTSLDAAINVLLRAHGWAASLSSERSSRLRALDVPVQVEVKALLDFVDLVVPRLDPTGRSSLTPETQSLWRRVASFAGSQGLQIIYPEPGTMFSGGEHEMVQVDMESTLPRNAILKVVLLGTRMEGYLRKAQVVVRG